MGLARGGGDYPEVFGWEVVKEVKGEDSQMSAKRAFDGPLTAERLRQLFNYEELTGDFIRLVTMANEKCGKKAGSVAANGYLRIRIDNKYHYCHRLAWLYVTGNWPTGHIDHINGVRSDNSFLNLREANPSQNAENRSSSTKNLSGFKGVYWHPKTRKWQAKIMKNGKSKSLGYFDDPVSAHGAYLNGRTLMHTFQPQMRSR